MDAPPWTPAPGSRGPAAGSRVARVVLGIVIAVGISGGIAFISGGGSGSDENTAKDALRDIAAAQTIHKTVQGGYANTLSSLGVTVDDDVDAFIATSSDDRFCAEASLRSSSRIWRFDSRFATVEEGRCPV